MVVHTETGLEGKIPSVKNNIFAHIPDEMMAKSSNHSGWVQRTFKDAQAPLKVVRSCEARNEVSLKIIKK